MWSVLLLAMAAPGLAFAPPSGDGGRRDTVRPEMVLGSENRPLDQVLPVLPNGAAILSFLDRHGRDWQIYVDPRSGRPSSFQSGHIPLVPGSGMDNRVTPRDVSALLGRPVARLDGRDVRDVVQRFVEANASVFGVDPGELSRSFVGHPIDYLWEVGFRRTYQGIPVRDAQLDVLLNHGNVVLMGVERWGDIDVATVPAVPARDAIGLAVAHLAGDARLGDVKDGLHLELVPTAPPGSDASGYFVGAVGRGYAYRLAWVVLVQPGGEGPTWEVLVDAHSGEVLSSHDQNQYATKRIVGGVFPVSNDGTPPDGVEQPQYPMPFANTGFASPNNFTNSAGEYNYTSGTVTTTLVGQYVTMADQCTGALSESSPTGDLDLGTSAGTDCQVPTGHSPDDTHSARSGFYELNRIKEMGRGWLPANAWLQANLTANMNLNQTCNAYWNGTTVNFFRSGGGCRNTGEIAAIFDHEWGHGMDDNDTNGTIQSPGEAIADIYAAMRLHVSCIGRGFLSSNCSGYGDACLSCTGVRDIDYAKHTSNTPHTPANFIATNCTAGGSLGPCGRETHCEGMVAAEAAWDLAARDLQSPPFSLNVDTAFLLASRLAFQGSGSITNFYTCSGGGTSSDGCAANNGYTRWLAADDDDGNVGNGTPHASAIWNALNRHRIACGASAPPNFGCATGPTTAPVLTATWSTASVALSWTSVPNAASYWVYKSEGPNGCNFGKVLIAQVATTSYTDTLINDTSLYQYTVIPVGSNAACIGPASNCALAGPPNAAVTSRTYTDSCPGGGTGNGDTFVDPGENVLIPITITNTGGQTLTGITGTLSTSTPGITVTDNTATWPDLAPGASAQSNANHFTIAVGTGVTCGSVINLSLSITAAQGGPFTGAVAPLTVGGFTLSGRVTTASIDVPKVINDNATVTSVIPLSDTRQIDDVNVTLSLTHTWDSDLVLTLISPAGTRVTLAGGVGGSGDNFTNTTFDDEAATPISSGTPPFTGSFRPQSPLSGVDGQTGNGTWSLEVQDTASADTGTLTAWSIGIVYRNPVCTTCSASGATPKEASPTGNMMATKAGGTSVAITYTAASCATDHAVYWGTSPIAGALSWTNAACALGTSGSATFNPGTPADMLYFVVVGQSATKEGSYGRNSAGAERPEAVGIGACDRTQDLAGSCP